MSSDNDLNTDGLPIDETVARAQHRAADWRRDGLSIAVVPTMGALHEGHLDLVRAGLAQADRVVVTIFVNPTQFAPTEDLAAYPRDRDADVAKLARLGAHAVFAPTVEEMYPAGFATTLSVGGPALGLETDYRPHFFQGVATVVAKLLIATQPDIAMFGEKDYQQLLVVRRMVADLGLPVDIRGFPTVREADGLALSSRNVYLSAQEREAAPRLHQALQDAANSIRSGTAPATAVDRARDTIGEAGFAVDYVSVRNAETLAEVIDPTTEPMRLLVAARLGTTRLIDNIPV